MRSRRPDIGARLALAALPVVGLPAPAQQVVDEGADFDSRIAFRAGHPAEGERLDEASEDRKRRWTRSWQAPTRSSVMPT